GKDELLKDVKEFKPSTKVLRIVLYGPTGSGKSSFMNSVQRVLLGRNAMSALENSTLAGATFTKKLNIHKVKKGSNQPYPLEIIDTMGIELSEGGIKKEDLIQALEGHILDGCGKYIYILVIWLKDHICKVKEVREQASLLGIPQVIVMTNVDKACKLVNKDLKKMYYSKKIKEKVDECSNAVGIPLNAIYPVKNYSDSITQDPDTDTLILTALRDILHFAKDYVEREIEKDR
ncbi:hypothetical protein QTP70_030288, partial [Hemibagrus guttatus]